MRSAVRSLHRYYACLVAQAALEPVADEFVERWEAAMECGEPPPDLPDLFLAVTSAGVPILSPLPTAASSRPSPMPKPSSTSATWTRPATVPPAALSSHAPRA